MNSYQLFDEQKRLISGSSNLFYSLLNLQDFAKVAKKSLPSFSGFNRAFYVGKFIKIDYGFDNLRYIDHKLEKI